MNNADMPAMPSRVTLNRDRTGYQPYQFGNDDFVESGLTKREEFAARAMWSGDNPHRSYETFQRAQWAINEADALLAALEKDNSNG